MTYIRTAFLALVLSFGLAPAFAQAPSPVPALPDTERRTTYSISATTCNCAVNFALYGDGTDFANWVEVFLNGTLVPASGNWTITSPSGPLGSIARPITNAILTFTVAQTGTVQIVGARRPRRTSQFNENAGVSARNLNQVFTDIISQNREIWDKTNDVTGRAVLAAPGETLALLPARASRLSQGACFNSNGDLTSCVSVPSSTFAAGTAIQFTGVNPTTISANPTASAPLVVDPVTKNFSCPSCVTGATALTSTATMAALKAMPAQASNVSVYLQGYTALNDGGEGWFTYDTTSSASDNGGTIIIPNSAPGTGRWLRAYVGPNGNKISVKWFGAKGDGSTNDTTAVGNALTVAIAAKGALYFPASANCYLTTVTVPDGTAGLRIVGDTKGSALLANNLGSKLCQSGASTIIDITATSGGSINNISVEDLKLVNSSSGTALKMYGTLWSSVRNVVASSVSGIGFDLKANGNAQYVDLEGYSSSGTALKISNDPVLTNPGPLTVIGGQFSVQNGTGLPITISGDPLGVTLLNVLYANSQSVSGTQICSIEIDGPAAGTPVGSVTLIGVHGESNFNFAGTLSDICIGRTNKFGSVDIHSGNSWGSGDGTHFPQYFLRVYAARNVSLRDYTASKLATAGYAGAMIRLESTFPAAGDKYRFQGNTADVTGTMYSDANNRLSGSGDAYSPYLRTTQTFTSGSGTYNRPNGVISIRVSMVGGGGGGGGSGTSAGNGGAGGNTTFSTFTANGGTGGSGNSAVVGTGGSAANCALNISGGAGSSGYPGTTQPGGHGGASSFGGSGWGGAPGGNTGIAGGANTGSGGGGGSSAGTANPGSGGGAGGTCRDGIINAPAATYSYAVGAAGTAGTAGTGGVAGGAGALGNIEVEESYQ